MIPLLATRVAPTRSLAGTRSGSWGASNGNGSRAPVSLHAKSVTPPQLSPGKQVWIVTGLVIVKA